MTVLLTFFLLTLAFCVGYAIRRGSICAVAATQSLIVSGAADAFALLAWRLPGRAL